MGFRLQSFVLKLAPARLMQFFTSSLKKNEIFLLPFLLNLATFQFFFARVKRSLIFLFSRPFAETSPGSSPRFQTEPPRGIKSRNKNGARVRTRTL